MQIKEVISQLDLNITTDEDKISQINKDLLIGARFGAYAGVIEALDTFRNVYNYVGDIGNIEQILLSTPMPEYKYTNGKVETEAEQPIKTKEEMLSERAMDTAVMVFKEADKTIAEILHIIQTATKYTGNRSAKRRHMTAYIIAKQRYYNAYMRKLQAIKLLSETAYGISILKSASVVTHNDNMNIASPYHPLLNEMRVLMSLFTDTDVGITKKDMSNMMKEAYSQAIKHKRHTVEPTEDTDIADDFTDKEFNDTDDK